MSSECGRQLSKRAETVLKLEDFLNKYLDLCALNEYDERNNPEGYLNIGTAVNNLCFDLILPKLTSSDVWSCDTSLLQYKECYGIESLRKAFAAIMNEFLEASQPVDPDDLFCVAGVTSCIDLIVHCLADPGEVILVPTPCYGSIPYDFKQRAQVSLWPIPVITKNCGENLPCLTLDKVKNAYTEATKNKKVVRAVFLTNPNNPLGEIYSPDLLMDIFNFCNERNLHVIVDEVYALSVFNESSKFYSALKFPSLPDKYKVHILYGISKDFGVAGLRVGVIHTRSKPLQQCLKQLSYYQNIPYPLMEITAKFIGDLEWCKTYLKENQRRLKERRQYCCERLEGMGLGFRQADAAFFVWVDLRSVCGSESFAQERDFFQYLFREHRLYIVPGEEQLCLQPGWFRLTFSSHPSHVEEGLRRLEKAIRNYKQIKV